jgi:hypothetical protein
MDSERRLVVVLEMQAVDVTGGVDGTERRLKKEKGRPPELGRSFLH